MIGDARHYLGIASIQGRCATALSIPGLDSGPVMVVGSGSTLFMLKDRESVGWSLTTRALEKEFDDLAGPGLKARAVAATLRRMLGTKPHIGVYELFCMLDRADLEP